MLTAAEYGDLFATPCGRAELPLRDVFEAVKQACSSVFSIGVAMQTCLMPVAVKKTALKAVRLSWA
ncbi:hypothetical protein [Klebsiella sp. BIGb0407]|uniref:hypothetical protein n=1 Tax=Klebsiella sp. BIGb0407 TaxID=2940603 RepID=UPI002169B39C|nr:hypothetical protein [Klebsiella sp. BIGb0407]MCS3433321.1 dihydroxyacetone kinase [Klebsiella sp. BIGb0407]